MLKIEIHYFFEKDPRENPKEFDEDIKEIFEHETDREIVEVSSRYEDKALIVEIKIRDCIELSDLICAVAHLNLYVKKKNIGVCIQALKYTSLRSKQQNYRFISDKEAEKIKELRKQGYSYYKIAKILNRNVSTIYYYCKRNNL